MIKSIQYVVKKYGYRWVVWIQIDNRKVLIANKLKSKEEVDSFIKNLDRSPVLVLA